MMSIGLNLVSQIAAKCRPNLFFNAVKQISTQSSVFNKLNFTGLNNLYSPLGQPYQLSFNKINSLGNQFSSRGFTSLSVAKPVVKPFLNNSVELRLEKQVHCESLIKWSWKNGKRKPNVDVLKRFKRLDWGIWIRPKSGANNHLWKKKTKRINRSKQIVFCNATQSRKLDIMVNAYWRKKRVFADDPYEHYLKREDYWLTRESSHDYQLKK